MKTRIIAMVVTLAFATPAFASEITGTLSTGGTAVTSSGNSLGGSVATSSGGTVSGTVDNSNSLGGTVSSPPSSSGGGGGGGGDGGSNGPIVGSGGGGGGGSGGGGSVLGASTSSSPIVVPGVPNTGAGGDATTTLAILIGSLMGTLLAAGLFVRSIRRT